MSGGGGKVSVWQLVSRGEFVRVHEGGGGYRGWEEGAEGLEHCKQAEANLTRGKEQVTTAVETEIAGVGEVRLSRCRRADIPACDKEPNDCKAETCSNPAQDLTHTSGDEREASLAGGADVRTKVQEVAGQNCDSRSRIQSVNSLTWDVQLARLVAFTWASGS